MSNARRVTLRDVAAHSGYHFSTVSLALRGRPGVPERTAREIRRAAEQLGYRPDPMLSSLAAYRYERSAGDRYRATLAWLTNFPTRSGWQDEEIYSEYFAGARDRADQLGYRLEDFWLRENGMTAARASQILVARGIGGLIVAPQPTPTESVSIEWDRFSAVTIGYSMSAPVLHTVCPNQYRCMKLAMAELMRRGYRRIGLVMLAASDARVDHNWQAGYLVGQLSLRSEDRLVPLLLARWHDDVVLSWLREQRPDALISKCAETLPALRRLGVRVPDELGVAMLTRVKSTRGAAGVAEPGQEVGAAAVDFLAGLESRGERGAPESPRRVLIDGSWVPGRSVRDWIGQTHPPSGSWGADQ